MTRLIIFANIMLSKLQQQKDMGSIDTSALLFSLTVHLNKKYDKVSIKRISPGGTLGIFFRAILNEQPYFIKTHLSGNQYKQNLCKEIAILQSIYQSEIFIQQISISCEGNEHTVLVMDELFPLLEPLQLRDATELIAQCTEKLKAAGTMDYLELFFFDELISISKAACEELPQNGLLSHRLADYCRENFSSLYSEKPSVICHGDLSNKNIMQRNGRYYAIDWEDALWGVPDYDLCYWLTFFDQRKYYGADLFARLGIAPSRGKQLMLFSALNKCYLSFYNNTHQNNKMSFDSRLQEIIDLPM